MAFETLRGESGVDFIGTANDDALFVLNESGAITAEANEGDDLIILSDSDNVVGTATIKGGAGDDEVTLLDQDGGVNSRLVNSSVNGGAGDDEFILAGAVGTVIRGNEDEDNFNLAGNYTNVTLNGNSGEDTFLINGGEAGGTITLSDAKILGGTGNDGAIDFTDGAITAAFDSTINGSKGNDGIRIGDVDNASNFFVYGGQGDDQIVSTNDDADGIEYSGDLGDDIINTGAADDSISGGDGDDALTAGAGDDTIDGGAGDDDIAGGGDDDVIDGGAGDDEISGGTGEDTITGGAGADTYEDNVGEDTYNFGSVSESAAATSGTDVTFDTIEDDDLILDLSDVINNLAGNRFDGVINQTDEGDLAVVAAGDDVTFGDIKDAFEAAVGDVVSDEDTLEVTTFVIDSVGDDFDNRVFAVIHDGFANLTSSDMMFELADAALAAGAPDLNFETIIDA